MEANFYLVIQGKKHRFAHMRAQGVREPGEVQVRKNKPNTRQDEIAVKVQLQIPDALFEKPTLQIAAAVPEGSGHGPVITTEVADNIADIIRQQTGVEVRISAPEPEPEPEVQS